MYFPRWKLSYLKFKYVGFMCYFTQYEALCCVLKIKYVSIFSHFIFQNSNKVKDCSGQIMLSPTSPPIIFVH